MLRQADVPICVFGWALIIYLFLRHRTRRRELANERIHRERLAAIERGVPYPELPPYILDTHEEQAMPVAHRSNPRLMAAFAAILILGVFGSLAGLLISPNPDIQQNWTLGLIPFFMGIGALLEAWIRKYCPRPDEPEPRGRFQSSMKLKCQSESGPIRTNRDQQGPGATVRAANEPLFVLRILRFADGIIRRFAR